MKLHNTQLPYKVQSVSLVYLGLSLWTGECVSAQLRLLLYVSCAISFLPCRDVSLRSV